MYSISVISKEDLEKKSLNDTVVNLDEISIVHVHVDKDRVKNFIQNEYQLIIVLDNNDQIIIDNFFAEFNQDAHSDLVLDDDDCAFLWVDFENGFYTFKELSGLELLLTSTASTELTLLPWIAGGILIGGGAAGLVNYYDNESGNAPNPLTAPEIKILTDGNQDGILSEAELSNLNEIQIQLTLPLGASTGNLIEVFNKNGEVIFSYVLTQEDINNNIIIFAYPRPLEDGNLSFTAQISNTAGKSPESDPADAIIDTTQPIVTVTIEAGESNNVAQFATFSFSKPVTGFDEYDLIVGGASIVPGSLKQNADGTWTVELTGAKQGQPVYVEVKDQSYTDLAGNPGQSDSDEVVTIKINTVTPQAATDTTPAGSKITGTTKPGNTVEIQVPGRDEPYSTVADKNGNWTIITDEPLKDTDTITAATPDQDQAATTDTVPLPFISIDVIAGDDIINEGELAALTDENGFVTISGTVSNPSADLVINFNGQEYSGDQVTVTPEGQWSIKVPALSVQENNNVLAGGELVLEDGTTITIQDATRPVGTDTTAPTVTVTIEASESNNVAETVNFSFSKPVTGFDESDLIVSGATLVPGSLVQNADGTWTAQLTGAKQGQAVEVQVKDKSYTDLAGNAGTAGDDEVVTIKINSVTPDSTSGGSKITGTTKPGNTVEINVPGHDAPYTVTADQNGHWTIITDEPLKDTDTITASTPDQDQAATTDTVPLPFISIDVIAGDDIINEGELAALTDENGLVTITGTVSNPSADLVISFNGKDYSGDEVTVTPEGKWSIKVPASDVTDSNDVTANGKVTLADGTEIVAQPAERPVGTDTTVPVVSVEVAPGYKNPVAQFATFSFSKPVTGFDESDLIVSGASIVPGSLKQNADGTWTVELTGAKQGQPVYVEVKDQSYTDLAGNPGQSDSDEIVTIKINTVTPQAATDTTPAGSKITGTTKPGNTVEIQVPGRDEPYSTVADKNGNWTIITDEPLKDTDTITAATPDQDQAATTDTVPLPFISIDVIAGDDIINEGELAALTDENGFVTITGTVSNPSADLVINFNGQEYSGDQVTVTPEGQWSIKVPALSVQENNNVLAGGELVLEDGTTITIQDATRPVGTDTTAPTVTVTIEASESNNVAETVNFSFSKPVTGFDESDLIVSGATLVPGSLVQNADGTWTAQLTGAKQGQAVEVQVKDKSYTDLAGNAGTAGDDEVVTIKINSVTPDSTSGGSKITGTTKPGNTVEINVPGHDAPYTVTADQNGHWTIITDEPLKDTDTITASTPDQDQAATTDTVPLPFISIDVIAGDDIINEGELAALTDENGLVTITGTVSNPSADLVISFNGKDYSGDEVTVTPEGKWSIKVPASDVTDSNDVTANGKVTLADGTEIVAQPAERPVGTDTTVPVVSVEVAPGYKNPVAQFATFSFSKPVTGFDESDLIVSGASIVPGSLKQNADGTWTVELTGAKQGQPVYVEVKDQSYTDLAGNPGQSDSDEIVTIKINTVTPQAATDTTPAGSKITGTTKPGNTVEIQVPGRDEPYSTVADKNGNWTIITDEPLKDTDTITASTPDQDQAATTDTVPLPFISIDVIAGDDIINEGELAALTDENGFVTISGTVSNPSADLVINFNGQEYSGDQVTVTPEGQWSIKVPALSVQENNNVLAGGELVLEDGTTITIQDATRPVGTDTTAPTVTVTIEASESNNVAETVNFSFSKPVTGFDESDLIVSGATLVPGSLVQNADGTWTAQLTGAKQGQAVEVQVKDKSYTDLAGNAGTAGDDEVVTIKINSVTPDSTSGGSKITGTTKPGNTVEINVPGHDAPYTVTADQNGHWTIITDEPLKDTDTITASTPDQDQAATTDTVPLPFISIDVIAGDDIINEGELAALTDENGLVTITGTVSNPSADLVISFNGKDYSGDEVTVTPEGKWSIKVPASDVTDSNDVTANGKVTLADGTEIVAQPAERPVGTDTTVPVVSVEVAPGYKNPVAQFATFSFSKPVTGFDESDLIVSGASIVPGSLKQNADGTWTVELTGAKQGQPVYVEVKDQSYTDLAGNPGQSDSDEIVTIKINTVTPQAATDTTPAGSKITGTTKPGNTVEIQVPGRDEPYSTVADKNGNWTIITDEPLKDTDTITAATPDQDQAATTDTVPLPFISIDVIAGDDIINEGELAALTDENGFVTISGTVSNPSADLVINFNGQEYSGDQVTVTPEGQWSIKVPALSVQENNNVLAGGELVLEDGTTITIQDATRPVGTDTTAPTVTVTIEASESNNVAETVNFSFSKPVTGFDESDLIVSGATLVPGSLVQNADGTWTAQLTGAKQGQAVEVQVKDKSYTDLAGNAGTAGDDEVVTIKINSVTPDSTSGGSKITGTTKPGNTVEINVPGHDAPYTVTADQNGHWTIITDEPLKDTDTITASTPDQDQAATTDTVPLPFISIDVIAGDDIINEGELAALTDENGLVTITGTVSNPSADLVISFNGKDYSGDEVTVTPEGKWSIKVPASDVTDSNDVTANGKVTLADGTEIVAQPAERPVGTDTTVPVVSVEVAPGYKNPVAQFATFSFSKPVTGFDESDLIVSGASIVPGSLKQNADGTWTVELTGAKQGQPVYVEVKDQSYTDLAGNPGQSDSDEIVTIKINTVTPQAATDTTPAGSKITGTTKPGNTVEIQVPGRDEPYSTVADKNGNWTIITDEPLKDTDTITAATPDQDQAATTDTVPLPFISIDVIAGDDIINEGELAALTDENGFVTITGTVSNPSADLVINFNGQEYSGDQVTVTPEGQWSIKVPALSVQENNNVLAGGELVLEDGTTITIQDATRPVGTDTTAPTVTVTIEASESNNVAETVNFSFSKPVTGFDESDLIVSGATLVPGSLVQNADGTWTAQLTGAKQGQAVEVQVKDKSYTDLAGNAGTAGDDEVVTIKINSVTPDSTSGGSKITGTTKPGNTVEINVPGHDAPYTVTADQNGHWTIITDEPLKDTDTITASTPDQDQAATTDTVPLPFISIDVIAGDDIINEGELAALTDENGLVTITGTVSNPSADLVISFNGKDYSGDEVTVTPEGKWSIKVPASDVTDSNDVTANGKVTLADGTEIVAQPAERPVGTDTTVPVVSVEVAPGYKNPVAQFATFSFSKPVTGFDESDLIVSGASIVPGSLKQNADGTWTVELTGAKQGQPVYVEVKDQSYTDLAGNPGQSDSDEIVTIKINTVTPQAATDTTPAGSKITGTTKPGNTVEIQVPGRDEPYSTVADKNGNWTIITDEPLKDTDTITASTPDQDQAATTDTVPLPFISIDVIAGDDIINEVELAALTDENGLVTITGTVSNPSADLVINFNGQEYSGDQVTVTPEGQWSIKVPALSVQENNNVLAGGELELEDGTKITIENATRPVGKDTTPPSVIVKIDPQGNIFIKYEDDVDPSTINPEDILITDVNGQPVQVTLEPSIDGLTYTAQLPDNINTEVTVIVPEGSYQDVNGNVGQKGQASTVVDTDAPSVTVTIDENGTITVEYEDDVDPKSIHPEDIKVTDKDGNPILDAEGNPIVVDFTPSEDGLTLTGKVPTGVDQEISVLVPEGSYTDLTGNPGTEGTATDPVDTDAPSVTVTIDENGTITVQYEDDVDPSSIDPKEIVVTDKDNNPIIVDFTPSEDGLTLVGKVPEGMDETITVVVPEGSYNDLTGNPGTEGTATDPIDTVAPTAEVTIAQPGEDRTTTTATIKFSEEIDPASFSSADLTVTGGQITALKQIDETTWEVELKVEPGVTASVTLKDDSYTDVVGNLGSGDQDQLITIKITGVTPEKDAEGKISTNITGKTEPYADVLVTVPGQTDPVPAKADENGIWTVNVEGELVDGHEVIATTSYQDRAGNTVTPADEVELPYVYINPMGGDDVINEEELTEITVTVDGKDYVEVTGTISNPKADLTVTFNGEDYTGDQVTITEDGQWSILVPVEDVKSSNTITAQAETETAKSNEAIRNPDLDNQAPTVTVTIDETGKITIQYEDDVNPASIEVSDYTVIDANGKPLLVEYSISEDGLTVTGQVTTSLEGKVTVLVPANSYEDVAGNKGGKGTASETVDTQAPTVTVSITPQGDIVVTYEDDVDPSTIDPKDIIITDSNGDIVNVTLTPSEDGLTFTGKVPSGIDEQITVVVPEGSYADHTGNVGTQGEATEDVDTDAPRVQITIDENGIITLTYPDDTNPDSIVTTGVVVKDPAGQPIENIIFEKQEDGTYTAQVPEEVDGKISVTVPKDSYEDLTGNPGKIGYNEGFIDTESPSVNVTIDEDGTITVKYEDDVDPKSINPEDIKVTDQDGKPVIVDFTPSEDGLTLVGKAPEGMDESITVVVPEGSYTDLTGNEGREGTATDPIDTDAPTVVVTIDEDGTITVKYEDDVDPSTIDPKDIIVTDSEGNPVIVDFTPSEDGLILVGQAPEGMDESITVVVPEGSYTDLTGNEGREGTATDPIDTDAPSVTVTIDENGKITVQYEDDVDPKSINPEDIKVTDQDGNPVEVEFTPSKDGLTLVGKAPEGMDESITVVVPEGSYTDLTGNEGREGTATDPIDTDAPTVVVTIDENGTITVKYEDDVDPKTINPEDIKVTDQDGKSVIVEFTPSEDGLTLIGKAPEGMDESITVVVPEGSYTDLTGNPGTEGTATDPVDTDAPSVTVTIDENGTITVQYEDDVDPSSIDPKDIVVTDKGNNPIIVDFTPSEDGLTLVGKAPEGMDESITVVVPEGSYTDLTGNEGTEGTATDPIDTDAPTVVVTIDEDGTITVKYEDDVDPSTIDPKDIIVTDSEGNPVIVDFTPSENGLTLIGQVPDGIDDKITVLVPENSYQDMQGNPGEFDVATEQVDTDAPSVTVTIDKNGTITVQYEDDVDPKSIHPEDIKVTDSEGNTVIVDFTPSEDGLTLVGKAPEGMDETITVVVPEGSYTDLTGNEGSKGEDSQAIDTDAPSVTVTIDENGTITVQYEDDVDPSSIDPKEIVVTDKDNNPIIVDFTPSEDGLTLVGKVPEGMDETITVVVPEGSYNDLTGNPGTEGTATDPIDTVAPTAEVIIAQPGEDRTTTTATIKFSEEIDPASFSSADLTVTGGQITALKQIDETTWEVELKVEPGVTASVTVKDDSYTDVVGNLGTGDQDQLITIKITGVTPEKDAEGKISTNITGKTEPNADVLVTVPGQTDPVPAKADENGIWTVNVEGELVDGHEVTATTSYQDKSGNTVTPADEVELPYVYINPMGGDDVINEAELAEITVTVDGKDYVEVTGTISNPKADLTVTFNGEDYTGDQVTITEDGQWSILVPVEDVKSSNTITAQAETETAKSNEAIRNPDLDNQAPTVTVTIDEDGIITVKYEDDVDPSTIDPKDIVVTDKDGNPVEVDFTPSEDGLTLIGKAPEGLDETITVKVPEESYTDKAGNPGEEAVVSGTVDTEAPVVDVQIGENGTITLTYPDDTVPESIDTSEIVITDPEGNVIPNVEFEKQPNGTYTAKVPEGIDGEITVKVPENSYQDDQGNAGEPVVEQGPVDTESPVVDVQIGEDGTITLTYPDDTVPESIDTSDIVITDPEGNVIPNVEFEKQPDGTYTAKVPEGIDGEITVKVPENSYQDDQGNAGEPVVEQGPVDTESPVVDVQIGEDGTITLTYPDDTVPESIDTSGIVITYSEGNVIPNVEFEKQPDGTYTAKLPEGIDGEITVKVPENSYQDDQGNAGEPVVEQGPVDTESPVVDVQIGEDGTITLTYPDDTVPESIDTSDIVITDPEGNVIPNVEFEKQPDGTYTAKLPEGIDGEITVKVPENSYQDDQGNAGEPVVEQGPVDTEAPTPTITIEPNGTITVQYGDDADKDTIDPQDIVVKDKDGNDIVVQFAPSEDGKTYTGKVPTAIDEEITVTVTEGSYQDTTGNDNRTSEDKAPIDTIAPQVEVQITEDGTITITYDDDVVPESIKVPSIAVQGPDNTPLVVEFVPSEDGLTLVGKVPEDITGQVTVTVPAGSYEDEVGNKGNKGKDDQIVDTEAPVVTVDVTPNGTITLTYPDDTDPDSIDTSGIVVTDPEGNIIPNLEFSKQPDGSYTAKVPEGIDGDITVKVPPESYEDQTGNPGQAVDQPAIVDTIPPKAQVEITEDGQIIVTYPEGTDPDSIDPKDIIVDGPNGPITVPFEHPEKQEDGSYVVTGQVPPNVDGEVTVIVPAESYEDEAGNPGLETSSTDDVDTLPPTVTVTITPDGVITLTYPDDVKPEDIDLSVITVTDADNDPIVVEFKPNGEGSYTAKVPNGNDGNVTVHVPENSYQDETGNPGQQVEETQPVDTIAPEATISIDPLGNITITYDDDVVPSTILEDRIKVTDTVTGETIVVEFTPSEDNPLVLVGKVPEGTDTNITVTVPAGSYEDEVGNKGTLEKDTADVDAEPPKAQVTITPDGQIIVTYPDDVDPDSIDTDRIVVEGPNGPITVPFDEVVKQPDGSYVVTGAVTDPVDGKVTVTVPSDSYTDDAGNQGTTESGNEVVDTIAPVVNPQKVVATEDSSVTLTWSHFGISDANTPNDKLTVAVTQLPTEGVLYYTNASGTKYAIQVGQTLTYADISAGKVTFTPDANEASSENGGTYADVGFSVSDGKHTTTGKVEIVVNAIADKPTLTLEALDWASKSVDLKIQTWDSLKEVKVGNTTYNLLDNNTGLGNGTKPETLKGAFEYLISNQTTYKPTSSGKTSSLSSPDLKTYSAVAITGYVYLQAGHTYRYEGKADDSGMLIIGNNDPAYVSWSGSSTSVNKDFTPTETGFYTFNFYTYNQAGVGNYDFKLKDLSGTAISYYPDLPTAIKDINDFYEEQNSSVEWTVSNLIQKDANDTDNYGFHRPYFNYSGEVGTDISLGLIKTGLNDLDGSELLTLTFTGLVAGTKLYAINDAGVRTLLGTAGQDGKLVYLSQDKSIDGQNLVAIAPPSYRVSGSSDEFTVKLTATATEQSNGSTASSEIQFGLILYPYTGKGVITYPADEPMMMRTALELIDHQQNDNTVFEVLNQPYALDAVNGLQVSQFTLGSEAHQINISSLLSDEATDANLSEFVTVDYNSDSKEAVISIDRDGEEQTYQSQHFVTLLNQHSNVSLDDLINNHQIIY